MRPSISGQPERRDPGGRLPPGWPTEVEPPDQPGWIRSAAEFCLDLCPPDYRGYEVLRRHPVILARFAEAHVAAMARTATEGVRTIRADLRDVVPPPAITAAIDAYEREGARLLRSSREVALVSAALRGERYVPRL